MRPGLAKLFANPPAEYRAAPFWAWNARIEPEECRRQIHAMKAMGMGGFFMHSRVGLDTIYMSDDWFRCVDACLDEAERLGMRAWLYDEDRWPSGFAGSLATQQRKHRMRALVMQSQGAGAAIDGSLPGMVAAFAVRQHSDASIDSYRRIRKGNGGRALGPDEALVVFRVSLQAPSDVYNGATYLDTLNPAAVREFIRVTHEEYRKRCAGRFGGTIPGIFTDEPNFGGIFGHNTKTECGLAGLPWTEALPAAFKRHHGYDLRDALPELFMATASHGASRVRYHYLSTVTAMFVEAFAKTCGEWCAKHNLQFTGHVLAEPTIESQANVVGSAMRFYEHMQAPGMDLLTECRREWDTAKGVSSVARQFGRPWRLTETYGCTGWDFGFEGHKALGDWQVALGINVRNPHLAWYSMRGQCKRDFPASLFFQSPWWRWYPKVEDYFARLHAVMSQGEEARDILVVHPGESAWLFARFSRIEDAAHEISCALRATRDRLLAAHQDFDYGEEDILARHGRVVRHRDGAATLVVAKARYRAVVVPVMATIRGTTLALLERFRNAGGTVVFAGEPAPLVDAGESVAAFALAQRCQQKSHDGADLAAALEPFRRVSIAACSGAEADGVLYLLREDRHAAYLFIVNTGGSTLDGDHGIAQGFVRDRTQEWSDLRIRGFADFDGHPIHLSPESGAAHAAEAAQDEGGAWTIRTSLPKLASRLYVIPREAGAATLPPLPCTCDDSLITLAPAWWSIRRTEPNIVTLDRPEYRIGAADWCPADEILRVDRRVRDALGIPYRSGAVLQPWKRDAVGSPRTTPVALRYSFDVECLPQGDLDLAMESPELFGIRLNGQPVLSHDHGWWCDAAVRRVALEPAALRLGANTLELSLDYAETFAGLEHVHLLGEFGVRLVPGTDGFQHPALAAVPTTLSLGDWVPQGLPFYAGSVVYEVPLRLKTRADGNIPRTIIRIPDYRGVAVRVLVDGVPTGIAAWPPYEVEISDALAAARDPGGVRLGIEVMGHLRNSHGPLHNAEMRPQRTGPGEFVTSGDQWAETYQLVPVGLMAPPQVVTRANQAGNHVQAWDWSGK